jgi:hypothetical protein
MQVAVGVGQHDPLRRLAPSARNGKCGRLARRQYRPEPLDRRLLPHALPRGHHHVEAVGRVAVVDQGGEKRSPSFIQWVVTGAEQTRSTLPSCMAYPRPPQVNMSAAWTVTAPVMASAAAARRVFMSFLANLAIYPLPEAIEALAQRAVVELMSWLRSSRALRATACPRGGRRAVAV